MVTSVYLFGRPIIILLLVLFICNKGLFVVCEGRDKGKELVRCDERYDLNEGDYHFFFFFTSRLLDVVPTDYPIFVFPCVWLLLVV